MDVDDPAVSPLQDTEYLKAVLEGLPTDEAKPETLEAAKTLAQQRGVSSSKSSTSSTSKKSTEDSKKKPDPKSGNGGQKKK